MNITEQKLHKLQRKLKTRRVFATMPSEPRTTHPMCKNEACLHRRYPCDHDVCEWGDKDV